MEINDVRTFIATRLKISLSQRRSKIDQAVLGALEEYGANIELARAQITHNKTIGAEADHVRLPFDYQRLISVRYAYVSGDNTYKKFLDYKPPSEFDELTKDASNVSAKTDNLMIYTISGDKLYVGIGPCRTGGTIQIKTQRRLEFADISSVPNGMIIVDGAVANMSDDRHEERARFLNSFRARKKTEEAKARPVAEKYTHSVVGGNEMSAMDYMEEL